MKVEIKHRWTGDVLFSTEAGSLKLAVEAAVRDKADLGGADLRGAYLRGTYLGSAYLRGAYLGGADLRDADLGSAYLHGAYLRGADLRDAYLGRAYLGGTDLSGVDLSGADLRDAYLGGACLSCVDLSGVDLSGAKNIWKSRDLIAEILFRAAGADIDKRKLAGLVLISRDWCWKDFLQYDDPLKEWAVDTLRPWAEGDASAPKVFGQLN